MSAAAVAPVKAPFENWCWEKFVAWFDHNGGRLQFAADVPERALGTWKWEKDCSCKPERLILTMNSGASGLWGLPSPKHHGDWGREAAIAHMIIHIEDGSQCSGADPQDWEAYERDVDTRAMARMGWTSWKALSLWNEELQQMVDVNPQEPHRGGHGVTKSSRRHHSATRSLVGASGGR